MHRFGARTWSFTKSGLCTKIQWFKISISTNLRVLMLDMTILFSNSSPKSPKKRHFWFQILAFLFFHEISQLDKFEGADFNYGNSIFKFQSKNNQIKHFWSQIYRFTKSRAFISNISVVFQSCAQNTQRRRLWSEIWGFSFLHKTLLLET